jgi:hypothetical protein
MSNLWTVALSLTRKLEEKQSAVFHISSSHNSELLICLHFDLNLNFEISTNDASTHSLFMTLLQQGIDWHSKKKGPGAR